MKLNWSAVAITVCLFPKGEFVVPEVLVGPSKTFIRISSEERVL